MSPANKICSGTLNLEIGKKLGQDSCWPFGPRGFKSHPRRQFTPKRDRCGRHLLRIDSNGSYALHYGYPGKSGIDITADNRKRDSSLKWGGRFDKWISKQKSMNNYRAINLKEIFV